MNKQAKIKLGIISLILLIGIFSLCFVLAGDIEKEDEREVHWINRYSSDIENEDGSHTSTFHINPQVFWNGTGWEELRFEDHYATEGYYLIENAHITAYIYDEYTIFYDPDNQRVSVDDERWIVEVYNEQNQKWREVDLYNPTLSYANNETHLTVTRTFDCDEGIFNITYIVWQGSRLKHDITFKSKMDGINEFRVIMKLTGIYNDKVRYKQGEETITGEKHVVSPYFFVGDNNDNLVLSEYLWSLGEINETTGEWTATTLKDIVFNTHAKGSKVDIIIGDYTLAEDESLWIDPESDTFYVGGGYDDAYEEGDESTFSNSGTYIDMHSNTDPDITRNGGFRFRSVSIPPKSTISSASVTLWAQHTTLDDANQKIYGNKVPDAQDFNDNQHIVNTGYRPRTDGTGVTGDGYVSWIEDDITGGTPKWAEKTGLENIIQEIINQAEWTSGNAIVLLFISNTDTPKQFFVYTYDKGSQYAAKLEVTWTPPDTTPPTYSNPSHNTTIAGASCNFSIDYDDDTALHPNGQWIFATNNTGEWVNESVVNFTSTPQSISVVKVLNDTVGLTIGYRWYVKDNAGNWNNTPIYTLTTTSAVQTHNRTITESFTITTIIDRLGSLKKDIPQSFTIYSSVKKTISRISKTALDYFKTTAGYTADTVTRLANLFREPLQILNINLVVDKLGNFFRSLTQFFNINSLISKLKSAFISISQSFDIDTIIDRLLDLIRKPTQTLNINIITKRTAYIFKSITQSFSINDVVSRLPTFIRKAIAYFGISSSVTRTHTPYEWAWTDNVTTLTQGQAYEGIRVPWELNDNWTVRTDSPESFTNLTKNYSLPSDCDNVNIEIDGVNVTGFSDLVSHTGCEYQIINNKTLAPGESSLINITYTTGATTSSEGDWVSSNKRIYQRTNWVNTLTLNNPTIHDYVNISINITTDKYAVPETINVTNASNYVFGHTFNSTNGNVNWTLPLLNAGNTSIFTIEYKTPNITLTKVNYTTTISGKEYEIYNVTVSTNSTRTIQNIYAYFNFSDEGIISNKFYKCSDGLSNCTEDISNRVDVVWVDRDGDGGYDRLEWYVSSLSSNQSYQLKNDKGYPIEVTTQKEILNPPIKPFDIIEWEVTITMYNPNDFATEKTYKYEFPLGSSDITLDGVSQNLQYDPFGKLRPYITVVDLDDSEHPNSVYLAPGETKTFILNYKTDSVTVYPSTYFPSYFKVGEDALIVQVLRIKNQAEDNVTDFEDRIPINYAKDLVVCEGEYEDGCPDEDDPQYDNVTLDTKDEVKGDYKLELDSLEGGEVKYVTLSYFSPTAILKSVERGRRSVVGNLTAYNKYVFESQAHFTMDDLRYREKEVKCEDVVNIYECRPSGICDIPLGYNCPLEIKLGTVGIGEEKTVYLWYVEKEIPPKGLSWIARLLNWGKRFELKGIWRYILGWFSVKDEETGKMYITTGRLIVLLGFSLVIVFGLIFIVFWKRKKFENIIYKE